MRSSAITLYIDTSSSALYTGIIQEDKLLAQRKETFLKDLSTFALYRIQEMIESVNLKPKDITRIVVVNGPGSFTGIRIGVTIAKTFAWCNNIEIVPISSLEAMAISVSFDCLKVPLIDARRGFVFSGIYNANNEVVLEEQYISIDNLISKLEEKEMPYQLISNDAFNNELTIVKYDPDILRIVNAVKSRKSVNPHAVNPIYLKRTEAEETKGIQVS